MRSFHISRRFLKLATALGLLFFVACAQHPNRMYVMVKDTATQQPLRHAVIDTSTYMRYSGHNATLAHTQTNGDGAASILLGDGLIGYNVTVSADGYEPLTIKLPVTGKYNPDQTWATSRTQHDANAPRKLSVLVTLERPMFEPANHSPVAMLQNIGSAPASMQMK